MMSRCREIWVRNLELRDEATELGIDHWVRQRFDRPYPDTVTLLERNSRKRRRQLMVSDREVHGAAEIGLHSMA
jgi:hypothetical protein